MKTLLKIISFAMVLTLIVPNRVFAKTNDIFDIKNHEVDIEESFEYTGNPVIPDIDVWYSSVLELNKDYLCKYNNNVEIGTATIEIIGIGDYHGSKTVHFKITDPNVEKHEQVFDKGIKSTIDVSLDNDINYETMKILHFKLVRGDGKLTFKSSNEKIFKVNKDTAKIAIKKPGIAYLIINVSETENYKQKTKKIKIIVHPNMPDCEADKNVKFTKNSNGTRNVTIKLNNKVKYATGYIFRLENEKGVVKTIKTTKTTATFKNLKRDTYAVFLYSYIETDEFYIKSGFDGGDLYNMVYFNF